MRSPSLMLIAVVAAAACTTEDAHRSDTAAPAAATLAGTPSPDAAAVRAVIEAIEAKQVDAVLKGDSTAAGAGYADDAIVMIPNEKMAIGHDAIVKGFGAMLKEGKFTSFTPHIQDLIVAGDYAIETATFDMTIQPKTGKPVHDVGKYLTIWKKQPDGSYKAIRDIFNSDLPMK
jgi:ketosteroid isomerase-like protein